MDFRACPDHLANRLPSHKIYEHSLHFAPRALRMTGHETAWGINPNNPAAIKAALALPTLLKTTDAAEWAGQATPERAWGLDGWMPMGRATLLTGEGGTGKSLLAQQLATCTAMGLPFMGIGTRRMNAVYLTCEDDLGELHRRQKSICESLGVDMSELEGRLGFVSRRGELSNSLVDFNFAAPELTPLYHEILATCHARAAPFLILDNIAHLFDGNENVRYHVAAFCNVMERLASEIGGAVLFLGHPSKAGAQFSGSTAWENQVRSRWFLERPDGGPANDHDMRILKRSKANYSRTGEAINLRWQEWAFVHADDERARFTPDLRATALASSENEIFLACLDKLTQQKRHTSHSAYAANYAPKLMAAMPEAKRVEKAALEQARERLFSLGQISIEDLWQGKDRHPVKGLARAGKLREGSPDLRDSYPDVREGSAQPLENTCGKVVRDGLREGLPELRDGNTQTLENTCGKAAGERGKVIGSSGGGEAPPIGGLSPSPYPDDEGLF